MVAFDSFENIYQNCLFTMNKDKYFVMTSNLNYHLMRNSFQNSREGIWKLLFTCNPTVIVEPSPSSWLLFGRILPGERNNYYYCFKCPRENNMTAFKSFGAIYCITIKLDYQLMFNLINRQLFDTFNLYVAFIFKAVYWIRRLQSNHAVVVLERVLIRIFS